MRLNKSLSSLALAGLLSSGLVACGGGGGSSGSTTPPADTRTEISGTAEATGNSVAMFEQRGVLYALGNFLIPSAGAAITGLQPVQGATVELIYVDDNGNQVGDVLASSVTSITGDYNLRLPEGVDLAANLVVRITGNSGYTLDSQVVSETVNINPYSDFLLDRLVQNGTKLGDLAINEVVTLRGKLEEFDLTAGADMQEMLAALDSAAGPFLDDSIAQVQNGVGDASTVAGAYHFGEFGLELDDSDGQSEVIRIGSDVLRGSFAIADNGDGTAAVTIADEMDAHFNLNFGGGHNGLWVESALDSESEEESVTVDGAGGITIEWGFEEDIIPGWYGYRYPAGSVRFTPVADSGIFLGQLNEVAMRYELTADDSALDPNAKHGDEVYYSLLMLAPKSEGLSADALSGDYGSVGMALTANHGTGNTRVAASYRVTGFDGTGTAAGSSTVGDDHAVAVDRAPNSAPTVLESTAPRDGTYSVTADGKLTWGDSTGFAANNGNVLALFGHSTTTDGTSITSATNSMTVAVKLPASQPDMSGRSYKLRNLMLGYKDAGTVLTTISGGVLTFNDGGSNVTLSGKTLRGAERDTDAANLVPISEDVSAFLAEYAANQQVTVGTNGRIDIATISDSEGDLKLDGFVSADGKLLVLRATFSGANAEDVGIFIGSLRP
jgi:hypothetical protein